MVSVLSSGRRRLMEIFHFLMCGGCYIKQLLLFTRPTAPCGRAVAVLCGGCYFFDARQKSNQKSAWGLRPSTPRCGAKVINISAPRQKCLSTFFLGCENDLRESNFRVGKSKDSPPTRVRWLSLCRLAKGFAPYSPFFDMRGVSLLVLGIASLAQLCLAK